MTRWDNITRWRAKDLWAGAFGQKGRVPLGRKPHYGSLLSSEIGTSAAYKPARGVGSSHSGWAEVAVEFPFEAVLGKTHRTGF
jgi:hypothetical protein